ncbi:unnamed protein product [Closterium sp. Yama58-4]|nr:unnamed protein product [Closterium sp. Yama58-4]
MNLEDTMIPFPESTHLLSVKPSEEDDMVAVPVLQSETDTWLLEPDLSRRQFWPSESAICQLTGRLSSGSPTASQTGGVVHVAEELLNGCGLIHVLPVSSLHGCSKAVANRGCSTRVANPGCSSVANPSCSLKPLPASEGSSVLLRQSAESTRHAGHIDVADEPGTCDGTADEHDTCDGTADEHDTCDGTADENDTCDGTADEHDTCYDAADEHNKCDGTADEHDTCHDAADEHDTCDGTSSVFLESSEEQQTPETLEGSIEQHQQQQEEEQQNLQQHQQQRQQRQQQQKQQQQQRQQQQSASLPPMESPQSAGSAGRAIRSPSGPLTMSLRSRAKGNSNSGDSPPLGALLSTPVASGSIPSESISRDLTPRNAISRDSTPRKRIRSRDIPSSGAAVETRPVRRLRVLVGGDSAEGASHDQMDLEKTGLEAVTEPRKRGSKWSQKAGSLKEINQKLLSPISRRQMDLKEARTHAVTELKKRGSNRSGKSGSLKEIDEDLTSPVPKRQSLNQLATRRSVRFTRSNLRYAEEEDEEEEEELQVAVKEVKQGVKQQKELHVGVKQGKRQYAAGESKQQEVDVEFQPEELQVAAVHVKRDEVIQDGALKVKQGVLKEEAPGEAAVAAGKENVEPVSAEQVLGMSGKRGVLQKRKQSFKHEARACQGQKRPLKPEAAEQKCGQNQKREVKKTKRGLPSEAVAVLRRWIEDNPHRLFLNASEKVDLVQQTGLTRLQVENWFCYARRKGYMGRAGDFEQSDSFPAEE